MKVLLIILFSLLQIIVFSQTPVYYDYIENWNWSGGWAVGFGNNTGYYNNAFVSSNRSAALIGKGNATSQTEEGYYILPNVTGLNPSNSYYFSFRLGSYRIFNTGTTSGNDTPDYIEVSYSTNNNTYTSEIKITGSTNAYWNYNNMGFISKTANGTLSTYGPSAGGNRTSTGDGYSIINLDLPSGITQCAIRIYCRVNSDGEEWWIDNLELNEIIPLPVELSEFYAVKDKNSNKIKWTTESEMNSSHFILQRSSTGEFTQFNNIATLVAAGNSTQTINYQHIDFNFEQNFINYYKLIQYDFDGYYKEYAIIAVDNRNNKKILKIFNSYGKEVEELGSGGIYYVIYEDYTVKRILH
jgi:hypothetical protein